MKPAIPTVFAVKAHNLPSYKGFGYKECAVMNPKRKQWGFGWAGHAIGCGFITKNAQSTAKTHTAY